MGRRRTRYTPPPPPPRKGALARAADAIWTSYYHLDAPYGHAYSRIARAFLEMAAPAWMGGPSRERMRDLDHVHSDAAIRWIARVRARDLLASVLLTDALDTLARFADAVGEERQHSFPTPGCKREITMDLGTYYVEFEVPEGARFRYRYEEEAEYGPGFRGVAFVPRCHLSSAIDQSCNGYGIVPGFDRCRALLGFDIPCDLFRHATVEGERNRLACAEGKEAIRIGVHVPFGFVVGMRDCDHWGDHIGPLVPRLGLDAMVELIVAVAREPEEVAVKPDDGAVDPPIPPR